MRRLAVLYLLTLMVGFTAEGQPAGGKGELILVSDSAAGTYGYRSEDGKMVIPWGKYPVCFTDTFRNYAIVLDPGKGIVAIDRQFHILYNVFIFDNGPDYPAEGLFRIKVAGKIGYADVASGRVVVKPRFSCAYPFENGVAMVALNCKTRSDGEHSTWDSNEWFYIDKAGIRVQHPKSQ